MWGPADLAGSWPCQRVAFAGEGGMAGRWWRRALRRPPLGRWEQCGLLHGHDGPCVPFVPGDYLRPTLAHPLDLGFALPLWRWQCPEGCPTGSTDADGPTHDMHGENGNQVLHDVRYDYTFTPCGHKFREIAPKGDDC